MNVANYPLFCLLLCLIPTLAACDRKVPAFFDETGATAAVTVVAFSPDSKLIAAGTARNVVQVWDLETHKLRWELPHPTEANTFVAVVAFTPTGESFVAGYADGSLIAWSAETGKVIKQTSTHDGEFVQLAISNDGRYLATECTNDRSPPLEAGHPVPEVAVWNLNRLERVGVVPRDANQGVQFVGFDAEDHLIVWVQGEMWQRYQVREEGIKQAKPSDQIRMLAIAS